MIIKSFRFFFISFMLFLVQMPDEFSFTEGAWSSCRRYVKLSKVWKSPSCWQRVFFSFFFNRKCSLARQWVFKCALFFHSYQWIQISFIERNSITFPFSSENCSKNKNRFFFTSSHKAIHPSIHPSIDIGQLLLIWTERFVSINPIAYNRLGFSFAHAHTNINTICAKSNALISLASKCSMIDASLTIVSVNKLDYLLRGTRANIWPQIDAIHSVPSGWLLMFKN